MLHHQSSQHPYKQGGVGRRIDIAANLSESHAFLDQLLRRHPELPVRQGHLAANLAERTERLADQHIHRVPIAGGGRAQIRFRGDYQGLQSVQAGQRGLQHFGKFVLQAFGHRAYQRALGAEAMADEAVAVARQLADFHQRRSAAALAFDQFEGGVDHSLIGQFAPLRLGAAPAWRAL